MRCGSIHYAILSADIVFNFTHFFLSSNFFKICFNSYYHPHLESNYQIQKINKKNLSKNWNDLLIKDLSNKTKIYFHYNETYFNVKLFKTLFSITIN